MRVLLLLAFLLAAPAAPAQAVPDTTDWRAYFPLEVGNRWQYHVTDLENGGTGHYGYDVTGETVIEGRHYFVVRQCYERPPGVPTHCRDQNVPPYLARLRYDSTHAMVVEWLVPTSGNARDGWWWEAPCALDAPFNSVTECTGPDAEGWRYFVSGGPGYDLVLPPDTVRGVTYKQFDEIAVVMGAVAGFGVVSRYYTKSSPRYERLVYARLGGVEYGTAAFTYPAPVAAAPEPGVEGGLALAVHPNPAVGPATVTLSLAVPGRVRAAVYDALGREVAALHDGPLGAGRHALTVPALALGVYVVRAVAGEAAAATRFVVAR